jgi:hypothetical protein
MTIGMIILAKMLYPAINEAKAIKQEMKKMSSFD